MRWGETLSIRSEALTLTLGTVFLNYKMTSSQFLELCLTRHDHFLSFAGDFEIGGHIPRLGVHHQLLTVGKWLCSATFVLAQHVNLFDVEEDKQKSAH